MKIVTKVVWLISFVIVLSLPVAASASQGAVLNVPRATTALPTLIVDRGYGMVSVASLPHTSDRLVHPKQNIEGDKLVLGGTYTLVEGNTLEGTLFVIGGSATLEEGSVVEKDVMVMGGTLLVKGKIEGDVNLVGGLVTLSDGALVEGEVNALGGNLLRDEGARVEGDVNEDVTGLFPFVLPGRIQIPNWGEWMPVQPGDLRVPRFDITLNPFWDGLWLLFRSFLWAALAVLVVLFLPKNSERAVGAIVSQPLIAGGMGCLTIVIAPFLLVLLAITICGIPLSVIGAIILIIAWTFGIIVVGMEIGKRLAQLMKQDWALPVSASIGVFVLTLVINSIGTLVPCIGWLAPTLVGAVGLGAVLITRFGLQDYPIEISPKPGSIIESASSELPDPAVISEEEAHEHEIPKKRKRSEKTDE